MSALEVARSAVGAAGGECDALVQTETSGLARFSRSEVDQPTLIDNAVIRLRVVRNGRVGIASTNRVDEEGLADVVRRAEEAASGAHPDPDFPGLADPSPLPDVAGYDEATARLGPEEQARAAAEGIAASGLAAYGFFTSGVSEIAIASSTGLEAEQRLTDASSLVIAADDRRSGYAEATAWRGEGVDPAAVAREASAKAERTEGAREVELGVHRAVLEPYALAELLQYFAYDTFGALGLLEERGYFAGRLDEKVFDEKISIADDSLDGRGLPKAFDFEGIPKRRVELVTDGVARGVVWDRVTAKRAGNGAATTGHAPPDGESEWGPRPFALTMRAGDAESVDELAYRVGHGIYVTRLHYLGIVDPRRGVVTGMTRDGTFRIRNGAIAEPLVNLRFTVAVPDVLREVYGLTRELKLVNASNFYGERYPHGALVPALATAHFNVGGIGSGPGV